MKFNSQICTTVDQSKSLLALGLKKETADMALIENWDYDLKDGKFFTGEYFERPIDYVEGMTGHYIPAWSLHRLIEIVSHTQYPYYVISKELPIYDALCKRIEWLIKKWNFPKEYLEEQV